MSFDSCQAGDSTPANENKREKHGITITPLQPSEINDAVALWHQVNLTRPWNDPSTDALRALNSSSSTILAARIASSSALAGTVMVGHDGHRGWVYYLAVSSDCQKRGIGETLMRAAEDWLRPHVPKLMLLVREDNEVALGFYGKCGYERSGVAVFQRRLDSRVNQGEIHKT